MTGGSHEVGRSRPARRIGPGLTYPLYLLAVLAALVWFCHHRYLDTLDKHRTPPPARLVREIAPDTMRQLGWIHSPPERRSAFANFPERKPAGGERIGCYGDSFTWGEEVGDGLDYPALLAEALRARGHGSIEVLNFGVSGYGMHQTAMLHEATAQRWELDRTVLLALPYWPERDTTFMAPWATDRLHARYIVDGGDVRLVDVVGRTYEEQLARYHALIPPLRYWRYDRRPPAFLLALLPRGRTLENPWNYRADAPAEEAVATYRVLLRRMATPERPVLLLDSDGAFASLGPLAEGTTHAVAIAAPEGFPYRAPRRHLSPWGNRWLAAQVADRLVGPTPAPEPMLRVTPLRDHPPAPPGTLAPGQLEDLTVTLDDRAVGGLFAVGGSEPEAVAADRLPAPSDTLIALAPDASTPLTDALFVPVGAAQPTVTVSAAGRVEQLGVAAAVGVTLSLRRIDLCAHGTLQEVLGVAADAPCALAPPRTTWSPQAVVAIDGTSVVEASVVAGNRILLRPTGTGYWIRARGDVPPAVETLPAAGRVWLRGRDARGTQHREALGLWTVRR